CISGEALAIICELFCEDYERRVSGLPDLFLWHSAQRVCKFVEVKGPGDTLKENQKVWIDILIRAGLSVDLCRVAEYGQSQSKIKALRDVNKNKKLRNKPLSTAKPEEDGMKVHQMPAPDGQSIMAHSVPPPMRIHQIPAPARANILRTFKRSRDVTGVSESPSRKKRVKQGFPEAGVALIKLDTTEDGLPPQS
ncbi:hypothetical protein PUNSTDRAFT_71277, partial [Punctularia strigosozonata HHB-11173 SS5]|uniref:uncharacterized protein n=1 Tax=Punctularia strigosozonata (strain HHB-11173) TaxID=741275 RepID=UPI00044165E6